MVKEKKVKELENLKQLMKTYKTVGIVDMLRMPTKQMQEIKKTLKDKILVKISKKNLLVMAFKDSDRLKEMNEILPRQPGLVFSNLDSFTLFREINRLRFKTYAKDGDTSLEDVVVQPGPTELLPGPAISELQKVGIIAGVEAGKIAVKKQSKILTKGAVISGDIASVLRKLKIQTAEIRMGVVAVNDGDMYLKDVLELVEAYPQMLKEAFNQALNLSVAINYPTKENVKYLLMKAYQQGKALESKVGK
ncbi:MAG: 50S ribosomal protein L10 [Candidatus Aenigmarchaeota archaeon]|nr:50S ribosomal protein L10 [Candidatus Aenigmarchaeota archaeon]